MGSPWVTALQLATMNRFSDSASALLAILVPSILPPHLHHQPASIALLSDSEAWLRAVLNGSAP